MMLGNNTIEEHMTVSHGFLNLYVPIGASGSNKNKHYPPAPAAPNINGKNRLKYMFGTQFSPMTTSRDDDNALNIIIII